MSGGEEADGSTVSLLLSGTEESIAERWILEVTGGPDAGLTVETSEGTLVAGTRADAGLKLSDDSVSRAHAELHLLSNGVLVVDLGSRNGTRIGGKKVERGLVLNGGAFRLGRTEIRVRSQRESKDSLQRQKFGEFITRSPALGKMLAQLERVARTSSTVLIEGETGTGKEVLARAIHTQSPRANGPMIVVDASSMVEGLLESQLFGHKKGAFSGAVADQLGAFEGADGGTLFLDELGELPPGLQPKLLRALESRTAKAVGSIEERPFDVRVVAATNRDLDVMCREGEFRKDLYYRVAVVRVRLPPLRERREDIELLAQHYVEKLGGPKMRLAEGVVPLLRSYDWPGNARELRNVLEAAIAVSASPDRLEVEDLFGLRVERTAEVSEEAPVDFHEAKERAIGDFEKRYVEQLLARNNGNITRAAKEAGISRNALQALVKRAHTGLIEKHGK
jgi:transcriptional regulator with PAS, ATPase and Fis domain